MPTFGYLLALTTPEGVTAPVESAIENALYSGGFPAGDFGIAANLMGVIDVIESASDSDILEAVIE